MTIVGRYAPSPTGPLHLGNLRTALLSWLHVRMQDGIFLLRIDDLDAPRNVEGGIDHICKDLEWLGLDWDNHSAAALSSHTQSHRNHFYQQAFEKVLQSDLVFECSCSRKDITQAASAPHSGGSVSIYPGTCRKGPLKPDRPLAWRFKVVSEVIESKDQLMGPIKENPINTSGDFVIKRKDGVFAYQFASVVDDGLMGVTDVLRGADLLDSTARQICLFKSLGFDIPRFWHVPLMNDQQGQKLSKRDGSSDLRSFKKQGMGPEEVVGHLAYSCGLIPEDSAISCQDLLAGLDMHRFRSCLSSI